MNSKIIGWLDLETSGLLPTVDKIFEVGIILTNWKLEEIVRKNWVVNQPENVIETLSPYVNKMHTTNGLLDEIRESKSNERAVEMDVVYFLMDYVEKGTKFIVAGNSVSFDKRFIEEHFKVLDTFLHHRVIDMTSCLLLSERWTPNKHKEIIESSKKCGHRAFSDIETCLQHAKKFKEILFVEGD